VPLVVLDVDNTLTEHNSWAELTLALGASLDEHVGIYRRLTAGEITPEHAAERIVALWSATGNATRPAMTRIFDGLPLRAGAVELVRWLQDNGFLTVLISGSMDTYVATVARRLGVDTWFASSRLEFDARDDLAALRYRPDQAAAKLEQLRRLCAARGIDIRAVTVVGDGDNDGELFAETGRGILLAADGTPRCGAWRVVSGLGEIPALLSEPSELPEPSEFHR
jgi:HAD superfamily phosphoserine phosphatase-like hydrolase